MTRKLRSAVACGFSLLAAAAGSGQAQEPDFAAIAPILNERCVMCHSGTAAPLGLRLDSFEALQAGGSNGPVAKAGDPAGSELVRRIRGTSQPRMPMTGPPFLSDTEIALIESWVAKGMQPAAAGATVAVAAAQVARPKAGEQVTYSHVAPIFATRCAKCHTEKGIMGPAPEGYLLTSYSSTISPADRVRVVPGVPGASELIRKIRGQSRPRMPFDGPPWLPEEDIALITEWVRQGARGSDGQPAPMPVGAKLRFEGQLDSHWAVDGQPGEVLGGTRVDKGRRPGDHVEVRGRVGPRGEVIVERIRRR